MKRLRLWTDGCCRPEPNGTGGWAFIAESNGEVLHRESGGELEGPANRMEVRAALEALRYEHGFHHVELLSDSLYVVVGHNKELGRWKRKGWRKGRRGGGDPILNADLWQEMDALLRHRSFTANVNFAWCRGHSVHEFNVEADQLAGEAARRVRRDRAQARAASTGNHLQLARTDRR